MKIMPSKTLRISPDLALPLDAVTETFGILAARGAGKSNTAAVMAEEMFKAKLPFVVIDPARAWWGLRASRDGKGSGLPIPIFGGKHGDLPLDRTSGKLVADLVVDQRVTCVLDITEFPSEAAKKEFLTDFAKRLYDRNEEPLHLFLEEADDYIPQTPMHDEAVMLRAFENIVRRGRNRGIGCTLITQRSAAINKNVLTQVQTLIPMRTTGPQDIEAIQKWVKYHRQNEKILESLSELEDGEGWVWSPQFLKKIVRVKFRRRETYDSGRTPKVTDKARPSATLADINLGDIKKRMETTIQRAEQTDPKALQRKVADLQRQLDAAKRMPIPQPMEALIKKSVRTKIVRINVPALTKKQFYWLDSRMNAVIESFHKAANHVAVGTMQLPDILRQFRRIMVTMQEGQAGAVGEYMKSTRILDPKEVERTVKEAEALLQKFERPASTPTNGRAATATPPAVAAPTPRTAVAPVRRPLVHHDGQEGSAEGYRPVAGERHILEVMVKRHPDRMTRRDVGVWAGFPSGGSSFNTYFPRLKAAGLVAEEDGFIFPTAAGLGYYANPLPPLDHQKIVDLWNPKLKAKGLRTMLADLINYRDGLTRKQLGETSGYPHGGSSFHTYLPKLKLRDLVLEEGGKLIANPALWPEELVR